jgi:hypothetical protein
MVLPPALQGSLPAGWLAFTGRELNPLDRDEGFQITSSSSLPELFLAQRPKTSTTADVLRDHERSHASESSKILASLKSGVSKPSVNQA